MHCWADLQSVHGFRCYDNIAANATCQRVLVLALRLVAVVAVKVWYRPMSCVLVLTISPFTTTSRRRSAISAENSCGASSVRESNAMVSPLLFCSFFTFFYLRRVILINFMPKFFITVYSLLLLYHCRFLDSTSANFA